MRLEDRQVGERLAAEADMGVLLVARGRGRRHHLIAIDVLFLTVQVIIALPASVHTLG